MMKGLTLIELLIVIAIISILSVAVFFLPKSISSKQVVDRSVLLIDSLLDEARSRTLSSEEGSSYGVHFSTSEVTLFKGEVYLPGDPDNRVFPLSSLVSLSHTLDDGGDEVVFERLTGKTLEFGIVTVMLNSDNTVNKTVTIYETGLSEIN